MQTLYEGTCETQIALLDTPTEVDSFLTQLEQIAAELSWQPGDQIRACAGRATHITGLVKNKTAGGLQVIVGNGNVSLPYLNVWPEVDTGEGLCAHVTILALEREYRGSTDLFWPLCVELWRWCHAGSIRSILLEATPSTMRVYRRMGWPLEIVGELRPHWGEDCYLCRSGIQQMEEAIVARASRSARYRNFVEQGYRIQVREAKGS